MDNLVFFYFYNFSNQTNVIDFLIVALAVYLPYAAVIGAGIYLVIHHHILLAKNPIQEFKQKWSEVFVAFVSAWFGWLIAEIIKNIMSSPRPFETLSEVQNLFPEAGFSFPSQHATFFFALAFSIYLQHKKAGYFFLFIALVIGIARISGGVHYPIDILGGIILGISVAYGVHYLRFAKIKKEV